MTRKNFWLIGFIGSLLFMFLLWFFNININNAKYALLIGIIVAIISYLIFSFILYIYSKYLTNYSFKYLQKYFNLIVDIHKDRYKTYFEYNQEKTQSYSELFQKNCTDFINNLEDKNQISAMKYSPTQTKMIEKMLKKAKEMQEKEFISDYSI